MSVTVKELKEILINTIGKDFINEGFSFNKSEFSFRKKTVKSDVECYFIFYKFPSRVEYHFTFTFLIKELEDELKNFFNFCGIQYRKGKGMYIREGDFHRSVSNKATQFRAAFTHIITDLEQDFDNIEETRYILRSEFFPRIEIFSNLQNFQKFILDDYSRAVKYWSPEYALLALKLLGRNESAPLIEYLKIELQVENLDPRNSTRQMIESMSSYEPNNANFT